MKKIALITGGTSGIGKACAVRFLSDGYKVIVTGRRQERLLEFQTQFGENDVMTLNFDVRDNNQVVQALQSLPEDWKNIDVLVNNAKCLTALVSICRFL